MDLKTVFFIQACLALNWPINDKEVNISILPCENHPVSPPPQANECSPHKQVLGIAVLTDVWLPSGAWSMPGGAGGERAVPSVCRVAGLLMR